MDDLVPIMGIIGVFGMPAVIVLTVLYFENKKKEKFHETVQAVMKSGQEVTPELLQSIPGYAVQGNHNDIRKGFIVAGVGLGVVLFGKFGVYQEELFGIGLLVLSIGIGFLMYGYYAKTHLEKSFENNDT